MKITFFQFSLRPVAQAVLAIGMLGFLAPVDSAFAQGRGGRGGGGGGMGGARPSMGGGMGSARPSMGGGMGSARPMNMGGGMPSARPMPQMPQSRPSFGNMPQSRPAGQGNFGGLGNGIGGGAGMSGMNSRPMPGNLQRPATGNMGSNRPSLGLGAPSTLPGSIGGSLGGSRPSTGNISARPTPGNLGNLSPSNRPNIQMPGSLPSTNRPSLGGNQLGGNQFGGNQPSTKPAPLPGGNRPSLGGVNRPNTLPGNIGGGIGTTKPAPGPGLGNGSNITGNRPGQGGGLNRPDFPGAGGGPSTKPNRPTIGGNRPGGNGGGINNGIGNNNNLPGITNRPPWIGGGNGSGNNIINNNNNNINRPGGWNRPDWNNNGSWNNGNWGNFGGCNWGNNNNRPNWNNNRPNWNNGNTNININNNNWTNNNFNRPFWDRPGYNNNWGNNWGFNGGYNNWNNGWYNHCIHPHYHGWYNGSWSGYWGSSWYAPIAWGAVGWGLGSLANNYYSSTTYVNPYYVATPVATASAVPYDYSQPVVVNNYITADANSGSPSANVSSNPSAFASPKIEESFTDFDSGLSAFKAGDYQGALNAFNEALKKNGGDPVVHEVRALDLFAIGDYANAAPALNSLLAAAPGMDWTTLSSLYGNVDDYTAQLRKLEEYCKANPKNPASAFVLAYHYLVIGQKDSAVRALKVVVENQPKDVTAKRMLDALDPKAQETVAAKSETEPKTAPSPEDLLSPKPETDLVGKWTASAGTTTIDLAITEESTFSWKATESGKPTVELAGDFGTNGDAILMETTDKGSLGGTVKSLGADEWVLIPPGAKDENAGLKFKRAK